MTTAQSVPVALPPLDGRVKMMEDRKRSLANDVGDDLAPSRKRMIKDENGQQMRMDAEKEKDVENYQKDAILRQMKEYKRQKRDAEERLSDMTQKIVFHDDHLRTIDAWFAQMLDEVQLIASSLRSTACPPTGEEMYKSALLFQDNEMFTQHLQLRSEGIKATITALFSQFPSSAPGTEEMRAQLNEMLAREKEHSVLLRKAIDQKESLEDRLEHASLRYMSAEKKLERAKSAQVLKLEKAANGGNGDVSSPTTSKKATPPKTEHGEANGELENGIATAEAEAARKEAIAAAEKQKAQLEEVETENERLTNELSAARTKLVSLSDDDYAESTLFKTIKSQHEDAIKRVNDLEALNIELREEATKMHADRTSHKMRVDEEHRANTADIETQIARADNDLARIRDQRDEYLSELQIRRSAEENRRTSADQAKELAAARDSKITALETEIDRLKLRLGDAEPPELDLEDQDVDSLKKRLRTLEGEYALLNREIKAIEDAFAKASATSSRKIEDAAASEEHKGRLLADKAKADQKYFATMKAKDLQMNELRILKNMNARSSEIVSQLKDTEGKTRELVANLEKQVAEARENLAKLESLHRALEQKNKDAESAAEGSKKQAEELTALIVGKDKEVLGAGKGKREAEEELERCKARLDDAKKQLEVLKKAKAGSSASGAVGGEDDWRKVAICPVCNANIRNSALKLCGHTFCSSCVKDLISNRSRKCPSCGRAFGNGDHMPIVLT